MDNFSTLNVSVSRHCSKLPLYIQESATISTFIIPSRIHFLHTSLLRKFYFVPFSFLFSMDISELFIIYGQLYS